MLMPSGIIPAWRSSCQPAIFRGTRRNDYTIGRLMDVGTMLP
jgi:hypothetical protein